MMKTKNQNENETNSLSEAEGSERVKVMRVLFSPRGVCPCQVTSSVTSDNAGNLSLFKQVLSLINY